MSFSNHDAIIPVADLLQGITEFLGVGSEQRTCALRAGPDGARVRFVQRQALTELPGRPSWAVTCSDFFHNLDLETRLIVGSLNVESRDET